MNTLTPSEPQKIITKKPSMTGLGIVGIRNLEEDEPDDNDHSNGMGDDEDQEDGETGFKTVIIPPTAVDLAIGVQMIPSPTGFITTTSLSSSPSESLPSPPLSSPPSSPSKNHTEVPEQRRSLLVEFHCIYKESREQGMSTQLGRSEGEAVF